MHRILLAAIAATAILPSAASALTRPVTLAGPFTKIISRGADALVIRQGPRQTIVLEGAPEDLDRMALTLEDDTLAIERHGGRGNSRGVTVTITLPQLDHLTLRGSGPATIDTLRQEGLGVDLSGSGSLTLRDAALNALAVSLGGSGPITATGHAGRLALSTSGSGRADLRRLDASEAAISVTGSRSVDAHVTGAASIDAQGSGSVDITGTDQCAVRRRGSGSVRCGR